VGVLALLIIVVPFLELVVLIKVGSEIGVWNTIGLLIAVSVLGAWLVKRQGIGLLRRMQRQLDQGRLPSTEVVDGFMILLAGALLITPGFLSDVVAILLLLPPVRAALRGTVRRRLGVRAFGPMGGATGGGRVHDVGSRDLDP